jgi:hypothetical protein
VASLAEVFVTVALDTRNLEPDLRRRLGRIDASRSGKQVGDSFGGGLSKAIKRAAIGMGALFAAAGIKNFVQGGVEALGVIEKLNAQSDAVIKSTAGVAGVTRAQLESLAGSIERVTSVEAESVQEGANFLLTFTNIRNEAGKGNDIFNQTVQAMTDLSVATGTDAKGAALQLGKALNDPIKGVSALQRVGVSFTAAQKDQIAALVESGDTMGAQKVILAELTTQFGGSAEALGNTFPGRIAKLKNAFGDIQETIVAYLLPAGEAIVEIFAGKVAPAIDGFLAGLRGEGPVAGFTGVLNTLGLGLRALVAAFKDGDVTSDGFVGALERVGVTARTVFDYVRAEVIPRLMEFARWVGQEVVPRVIELAQWIGRNRDFFIPFVAALTAGVAVFRTIVAVTKAWAVVQGLLNVVLTANPIGLVIVVIAALAAGIVVAYQRSETFRDVVQTAWAGVQAAVSFAWNNVIKPIFKAFVDTVVNGWRNFQTMRDMVDAAMDGLRRVVRDGVRAVIDFFLGMAESILGAAEKALGWMPGIGDKVRSAVGEFRKFRDGVNAALNAIDDKTVTVTARLGLSQRDVPLAYRAGNQRLAVGGKVRGFGGPTQDNIPILASAGEHMWTVKEVDSVGGHAAMARMRKAAKAGAFKGYADGGPIGFDLRANPHSPAAFAASMRSFDSALTRAATDVGSKAARAVEKAFAASTVAGGGAAFAGTGRSGNVAFTRSVQAAVRSAFPGTNNGGDLGLGRVGRSKHNQGKALDIFPGTRLGEFARGADLAMGNRIVRFLANQRWNTDNIIWQREIYNRRGRRPYTRYGSNPGATLGHYDHVHWDSYDDGGTLPPRSATLAINRTSRSERIRSGDQEDRIVAAIRDLRSGESGGSLVGEYHYHDHTGAGAGPGLDELTHRVRVLRRGGVTRR